MKSNYKLNGTSIKRPHSFKIERYNITKSKRLSSGLMTMELIAQKLKFYLSWEAITGRELNTLLDIIWYSKQMFFTFEYVEDNKIKTATVYVGDIPQNLHRTDDGDWVWKDVEIHLIEQ